MEKTTNIDIDIGIEANERERARKVEALVAVFGRYRRIRDAVAETTFGS